MSESFIQFLVTLFGGCFIIIAVFIANKLSKANNMKEDLETRMRDVEVNKVNVSEWHESTKDLCKSLTTLREDQRKIHSAMCWLVGKQGGTPDEAGLT